MQVGEEFCGSKSEVLQESIKRQSVNYFKNYHRWDQDEKHQNENSWTNWNQNVGFHDTLFKNKTKQ